MIKRESGYYTLSVEQMIEIAKGEEDANEGEGDKRPAFRSHAQNFAITKSRQEGPKRRTANAASATNLSVSYRNIGKSTTYGQRPRQQRGGKGTGKGKGRRQLLPTSKDMKQFYDQETWRLRTNPNGRINVNVNPSTIPQYGEYQVPGPPSISHGTIPLQGNFLEYRCTTEYCRKVLSRLGVSGW
eukprot:SAG11_NODE_7676_length_1111_cov_2.104743_2_plen_185_part_00